MGGAEERKGVGIENEKDGGSGNLRRGVGVMGKRRLREEIRDDDDETTGGDEEMRGGGGAKKKR